MLLLPAMLGACARLEMLHLAMCAGICDGETGAMPA